MELRSLVFHPLVANLTNLTNTQQQVHHAASRRHEIPSRLTS
jgi:hypothetical protein